MGESGSPSRLKACSHCGGTDLYTRRLSAGGSDGPYFLKGLGHFLHFAEFDVLICAGCGLTYLFTEPEACQNVKSSNDWKRL